MSKINIEGFLSNPFFIALKNKEMSQEKLIFEIKNLKSSNPSSNNFLVSDVFKDFCSRHNNLTNNYAIRENYEMAIEIVIIKYFYEYDVFKLFIDNDEDYEKLENCIKRKQYEAKIVKTTLAKVESFIIFLTHCDDKDYYLLFDRDIMRAIEEVNNQYVLSGFKELKDAIDKITSGVKTECYLDFNNYLNRYQSPELEEYITNKYHPLKNVYTRYIGEYDDSLVLSLSIINDISFWRKDNYYVDHYNIISFSHLVAKYNGITYAKKIVDYAYKKTLENPINKFCFDNNLSLCYSMGIEKQIIKRLVEVIENKTSSTNKIEESDYNGLLYPLYDGFGEQITKGKNIFNDFIKYLYPSDFNTVLNIFSDFSNVIQDEKEERNKTIPRLTLGEMLDRDYFYINSPDKKFMYGYYKDFGSDESILNRFYYRCYLVDKLNHNTVNESLYELFFDLFEMIDSKYNTKCFLIYDNKLREENYSKLKELLIKYDFNIDDKYKENYIIALLDRKYATHDEAYRFAELEQFGDAIYDLAISSIFYYQEEDVLDDELLKKYANAEAQIEVSKNVGLDKLYISNMEDIKRTKYLEYERYDIEFDCLEGNYIADSLEMVIAAIAYEFGLQKALDFSIKIILNTYKDIKDPMIIKFEILNNSFKYNNEYLDRIFPRPFIDDDNYTSSKHTLSSSLRKLINICINGNDTKEKRIRISHSFDIFFNDKTNKNDKLRHQIWVSYLYEGIEATINKYRELLNKDDTILD